MKKIRIIPLVALLTLLALTLTACGNSVFMVTENTGKKMVITAEKAAKNSFFAVDALEVAEGEQIVISAALTKGMIGVRIYSNEPEESIEALPEYKDDPIISADLHDKDGCSGTVPAGTYTLHATCLDKATGTIEITVVPAP